ncbi:MAG: TonB-dependent receptor [Steroidobacteraceae bacterium]
MLAGLVVAAILPQVTPAAQSEDLLRLSLAELGDIQVTSVSKTPELLREAPAAIYVITQDDIRRSGATSLAEALRLAPNLRMTQLSSSNYVTSARGMSGRPDAQNFSNKLLILIDGRSVYTPLFSGIILDSQDVALSDISRIEVISGPGATLWGANAMNGVINIITRPAYLTQGAAVTARAGNRELGLTARYGSKAGEDGAFRVYGKAFERDAMSLQDGSSAGDSWRRGQAGFRMDFNLPKGTTTLQGDAYAGSNERAGPGEERVSGANLLGRWESQTDRSEFHLQAFVDHMKRGAPLTGIPFQVDTFDVEAQQSLLLGSHKLVWGGGGRFNRIEIDNSETLLFLPSTRNLELWNIFGQDTLTLNPSLKLTVGLKLEHNSFSGWEPQPDARLAWQATDGLLVWAAASRAIRAPTPFDVDVVERIGGRDFLVGNPEFQAENVITYETGIRASLSSTLLMSMSTFYNRYNDLRTVEFSSPPTLLPLFWDNRLEGHTYGMTAWAQWQVTPRWRLAPGFELLEKRLDFKPGASGLIGVGQAGNDPQGHALLTSSLDLGRAQSLEFSLRHVGRLPDPALAAYTELSARYAWRTSSGWELSVHGVNLLHGKHQEYPGTEGAFIRRAIVAEARWRP